VLGRFAIIRSAAEETLLTLFDTFKGPFADILDATIGLITDISEELGFRTAGMANSFDTIFGQIADFIRDNSKVAAVAIADFIGAAQDLAVVMSPLIALVGGLLGAFVALAPIADELAIVLTTIAGMIAAVKIALFTSQLLAAIPTIGAATAALWAMATALAASTAGLSALAAAVAVMVAGAAVLIRHLTKAKDAAQELADVREAIAREEATSNKNQAAQLGFVLGETQSLIETQREQLRNSRALGVETKALTAAEEAEHGVILRLNDAQATRMFRLGKLVKVGENLRTVEFALRQEGEAGVSAVRKEIATRERQLGVVKETIASQTAHQEVRKKAQREADELRTRIENLNVALAKSTMAQDGAAGGAGDLADGLGAAGDDAEDAEDKVAAFGVKAADAMRQLAREIEAVGQTESEALESRFAQRAEDVERMFAEELARRKAAGEDTTGLEEQKDAQLMDLARLHAAEPGLRRSPAPGPRGSRPSSGRSRRRS
jgi:hypothetical protein